MTDTKATITDPEEFLKLSAEQLDDIFRNAPAGTIPNGEGDGTAIIAPGTVVSDTIAKFVHIFTWKGKFFEPDPVDPQRAGSMEKSASSWITRRPPSWRSGFATRFARLARVCTWASSIGERRSRMRTDSFTSR
jgi:hypothetical protein